MKLRKPCHQCGKLMDLPWNMCPFCGTPVPGVRRENLTLDEALNYVPIDASELDENFELPTPDEEENFSR